MKFSVNAKFLKDSLSRLSHVPGAGSTPISAVVLMEVELEEIRLTRCSDHGISQVVMPVETIEDDGTAIVGFDSLLAFSNCAGLANIKVSRRDQAVEISSTDGKNVRLAVIAKAGDTDFHETFKSMVELMRRQGDRIMNDIDPASLAEAIRVTKSAMSTNASQPDLQTIAIREINGDLALVATDKHRIHFCRIGGREDTDISVSSDGVELILSMLEGDTADIEFRLSEGRLSVKTPYFSSMFALSATGPPKSIETILSQESQPLAAVNREQLISSVAAASPFSYGGSLNLDFDGGALVITGDNASTACFTQKIGLDGCAKKQFNTNASTTFLSQMLKASTGDIVEFEELNECAFVIREENKVLFLALIRSSEKKQQEVN